MTQEHLRKVAALVAANLPDHHVSVEHPGFISVQAHASATYQWALGDVNGTWGGTKESVWNGGLEQATVLDSFETRLLPTYDPPELCAAMLVIHITRRLPRRGFLRAVSGPRV
jgi:hypothetical protein